MKDTHSLAYPLCLSKLTHTLDMNMYSESWPHHNSQECSCINYNVTQQVWISHSNSPTRDGTCCLGAPCKGGHFEHGRLKAHSHDTLRQSVLNSHLWQCEFNAHSACSNEQLGRSNSMRIKGVAILCHEIITLWRTAWKLRPFSAFFFA